MAERIQEWRRSSHCEPLNCVEMTFVGDSVWVRDSFDRDGQILAIPVKSWTRFLVHVRGGEQRS